MNWTFINNPRKYTKQIIVLILNELWKRYKMKSSDIKSLLGKLSKSLPEKVQSRDYIEKGLYPVIDQWKTFIWGYSDLENAVINFDLPLIIFWDHTKQIKYIDFPFIQGADWIKLLKNKQWISTKFFYYLLHTANIENRWYSRHYKYLCSSCVLIPDIEDENESILLQNWIADFLDAIFTENCDFDFNYFDLWIQNKVRDFLNTINSIDNKLQILKKNEQLVKQLKSSILQDAIQWKLVPQDPSDEPASILIEKIQAEKIKLITEWKLKKQKPLVPIKSEEIPYELPEGWEWVRFGEVVSIESNLVNPNEYPNFPHIAPDNIEKNTGKLLNYKTVIEDEINSSNHLFKSWHILYSKVRPKLNKVIIVDFEGLCSADMYPIKSYINKYYLKNVMLSTMFLDQIDAYDNRVKMPKINQNDLSLILIPVPSEKEQARIVEKSNELMQSCELLGEQVKQAKGRSEKLMESVLQGVFNW